MGFLYFIVFSPFFCEPTQNNYIRNIFHQRQTPPKIQEKKSKKCPTSPFFSSPSSSASSSWPPSSPTPCPPTMPSKKLRPTTKKRAIWTSTSRSTTSKKIKI